MITRVLYISAVNTVLILLCDKLDAPPLPGSIDDQVHQTVTRVLEEDISGQVDPSQRMRRLRTEFKSMARSDNVSCWLCLIFQRSESSSISMFIPCLVKIRRRIWSMF
eukprot:TRINITY_DN167914_c0_g1_i1.p1 TRINITY_DN167914_c0_g1~~TRINITY_DN167914_c0_g1_i1.p1  ORF type:complete len:108 (-),score=9.49 TRINITY_DN167914_c0_g1_i1:178-501(-)